MPAKSTRKQARAKPTLSKDFPLYAHASGQLAKRIAGRTYYFGSWSDPEKARQRYLDDKDDLYGGRVPASRGGVHYAPTGPTIKEVCDGFYEAKRLEMEAGDISFRTLDDYDSTAKLVCRLFDKNRPAASLKPADFQSLRAEIAKTRNANSLGNEVQRIRTLFRWASESDLIDRPIKFGPSFKRPRKDVLRRERQKKGPRKFEARHLRRLLKTASPPMRAMILLGLNCGFGNSDCGKLPLAAIDLDRGWIDFPRPKTAIERRVPLWPETIAALSVAIEKRPQAKAVADRGLAFITRTGGRWSKDVADSPVSKEFRKMLDTLNLYRCGLSFYTLRHQFETIAGGCRDQVAVNAIMGHVDSSMAAEYREDIADGRLRDAANEVRRWLFRRDSPALWRMSSRKGG